MLMSRGNISEDNMRLRDYFIKNNIEIKAWCQKIGISDSTVHNWMRGAYPSKAARLIVQVATNQAVKDEDWVNYGGKGKYERKKGSRDYGVHDSKRVPADTKLRTKSNQKKWEVGHKPGSD